MENIQNIINDLGLREISFNKEGSKYLIVTNSKIYDCRSGLKGDISECEKIVKRKEMCKT